MLGEARLKEELKRRAGLADENEREAVGKEQSSSCKGKNKPELIIKSLQKTRAGMKVHGPKICTE